MWSEIDRIDVGVEELTVIFVVTVAEAAGIEARLVVGCVRGV